MTFPNRPDEGASHSNRPPVIGPIVADRISAVTPPVAHQLVPPLLVPRKAAVVDTDRTPPAGETAGLSASRWTTADSSIDAAPKPEMPGGARPKADPAGPSGSIGLPEAPSMEGVEAGLDAPAASSGRVPSAPETSREGVTDMWEWAGSTGGVSPDQDSPQVESFAPEPAADGFPPASSGDWDDGYDTRTSSPGADALGPDTSVAWSGAPPASEERHSGEAQSPGPETEPLTWPFPADDEADRPHPSLEDLTAEGAARSTAGIDAVLSDAGGWDAFRPAPPESSSNGPLGTPSVWQDDASGTGYERLSEDVQSDAFAPDDLTVAEHREENAPGSADQPAAASSVAGADGGVAEELPGEPSAADALQNTWESTNDLSAVEAEALMDGAGEEDGGEDGGDWYASAVIVPEPYEPSPGMSEHARGQPDLDSRTLPPTQPPNSIDARAHVLAGRLERIAEALRAGGASGALAEGGKDPLAAMIAGYLLGMSESTPRDP